MSQRSRASRLQPHHVHCDSCYSRRCRARVEASVCCAVASCRLLCGAVFHLCKEEDHLLLCPNVRVPCLNAAYGCPAHLSRSSRAAHLRLCPASVVCCSMEWLRWPEDETSPHSDRVLQEKVLEEPRGREEALDLAVALVDQSDLYARLKMKPLYPELMEPGEMDEEIKEETKEEEAIGGVTDEDDDEDEDSDTDDEENTVCKPQPVEQSVLNSVLYSKNINIEKYNLCEMMFGMERGACAVAKETTDSPTTEAGEEEKKKKKKKKSSDHKDKEGDQAAADKNCPPVDTSKTGLAPWQEGVMERLAKELTPQEYNMYVVHHGRMLLRFGHMEACTPRERDFVYGSLEPIPVQTLRSFKIPDSYHYKRRVDLFDTAKRPPTDTHGVDTSDLGSREDDWFTDEAEATLLEYAEREVMGHKISETKGIDGLYVDTGTQTHSFRSSPFTRTTTLGDVMAGKPARLRVRLQAESLNSRHNKGSCFAFLCGHTFHRREFATHYRNVHSEIQMCLSGWFEQRCPLSYLGCTFSHRRFQPSTHRATVTYDQQLRAFNLRPTQAPAGIDPPSRNRRGQAGGGGGDALSALPYEVLCHVAGFLDSLSLSQLALVSRLMRQVASSLLQERGMVTLRWQKDPHGGAKWRATPVWEFSHLFSPVDSWHMDDVAAVSAHLKVCPFYETSPLGKRVALVSMVEKKGDGQEERVSLVKHFSVNRGQK